jgi:hypothetical protein
MYLCIRHVVANFVQTDHYCSFCLQEKPDEHGQGKWEGKQEGKSDKRITESPLLLLIEHTHEMMKIHSVMGPHRPIDVGCPYYTPLKKSGHALCLAYYSQEHAPLSPRQARRFNLT